jgi:hypothetical protein
MMEAIVIGISAVGGWLLREIAGAIIKRFEARAGATGFIPTGFGFFALAELEDGRKLETETREPWRVDPQALSYPLTLKGELFNDTDTDLLLLNPRIIFVHPVREPFLHSNPRLSVSGVEARSVTVPSHSSVPIRMVMLVGRDELTRMYADTLPRLEFTTPGGRTLEYRGANSSSFGENIAVWSRVGERPVLIPKPRAGVIAGAVEQGDEADEP